MNPFIKGKTESENHLFPHLGQRIVKTTIAVYLCLLVCYIRGQFGVGISAEAAITAIICMQPYVKDTTNYAIDRFTGTLIGSVWGLLFLLILDAFPILSVNRYVMYGFMALGVLLSLYSSVLFRRPDTSSLSAIVFVCIVIAFPDIDEPLVQAGNRFIDVLVGTTIATGVNVFRLPRDKNRNLVFFVRTKDLVPDRFSQIEPAVMFRLNYLYKDGAKICLMSEHAPAFFASQMSMVRMNTPLIVMDGAAVYDTNQNKYLYKKTLSSLLYYALCEQLKNMGVGYFIYTIHNDKTCIFHQGETTKREQEMLQIMRRSPYRSYLEGEIYDPDEVVYLKIMGSQDRLVEILKELCNNDKALFEALRPAIRMQADDPEDCALYLYSGESSIEKAQEYLMSTEKVKCADFRLHEVKLRAPYHSERDALHLLNKLERAYEPIRLPFRRRKNRSAGDGSF